MLIPLGIIVFILISYSSALIVDIIAYAKIGSVSYYISITEVPQNKNMTGAIVWGITRMWTTTLAVAVTLLIESKNPLTVILNYMRISLQTLIIYLLTPFIVIGTLGIYYLIAKALKLITHEISELKTLKPPGGIVGLFLLAYVASITMNALASLGEEIGWRGYLLTQLKSIGIIESALIIGIMWGLWHASAIILLNFNIPTNAKYYNKLTVVLAFTLTLMTISIPATLLVIKTNSILPAIALHGAINAMWGITILISNGRCEITGMGLLAAISWGITSTIFILILLCL